MITSRSVFAALIVTCAFVVILFPVLAAKDTSENMDSKAISSAIAAFSAKFCNVSTKHLFYIHYRDTVETMG